MRVERYSVDPIRQLLLAFSEDFIWKMGLACAHQLTEYGTVYNVGMDWEFKCVNLSGWYYIASLN